MGLNWSAGLNAAGDGLRAYAERSLQQQEAESERLRREKTMAMLRQQSLDDLAAANTREDEENRRKYGPVVPAPEPGRIDFSAPGLGAASTGAAIPPNDTFNFMGVDLSRSQNQGRYASEALGDYIKLNPKFRPYDPNDPNNDPDVQDYYMQTPDGGYAGFSGQPWSAAGEGRRANVTGQYNGKPTIRLDPWSAPRPDAKLPDPREIAGEWYGGWTEKGAYDKKTGTAAPYRYSYSGKAFDPTAAPLDISADLEMAVQREQDAGNIIDTAQEAEALLGSVLGGYNQDLARQMDINLGSAFDGWNPDTKMVNDKPVEIPGQYRKTNIPAGPDILMNKIDWMKRDETKSAAEFYADIVNKQLADGTDEVEMKTINAWLKKKGLTLDQLSQYIDMGKAQGIDLPAAGAAIVQQRQAPKVSKQAPAGAVFDEGTGKFWVEDGAGNWVVAE
jgi:hypothetical protein